MTATSISSFTELPRDQTPDPDLLRQADGHIWIFAYGSLIWNPELDYDCRIIACVQGLVRDFALESVVLRGTPDCPGRVLGLRPPVCQTEPPCVGAAYRLTHSNERESLRRLWQREMTINAYCPVMVDLGQPENATTPDAAFRTQGLKGQGLKGLTFMIRPGDPLYVAPTTAETVAEIVSQAQGQRGMNSDYVIETAKALDALGLCDPHIEAVAQLLQRVEARRSKPTK